MSDPKKPADVPKKTPETKIKTGRLNEGHKKFGEYEPTQPPDNPTAPSDRKETGGSGAPADKADKKE